MDLNAKLASTNLSLDQRINLQDFVTELKYDKDVAGVLLFGSAVKGDFDRFSDIDLIVFTNSKDFTTPESVYDAVSKNYFSPLTVQIKSINEFLDKNKITLNKEILNHYKNVGLLLVDKLDIEKNIEIACDSECFGEQASHLWYNFYRVRKDFLLSKYVSVGIDDAKSHIHPVSPAHFYHQTVRRVLGVKVEPEQDNRSAIIKQFYEIVNLPARFEELKKLREKDKTNSMNLDDFRQFKGIIEEAAWALNNYLNKP